MGCCDLLRADHRRTEGLLDALAEMLRAGDLSGFRSGFEALGEELLRHYLLEERALFPVLSMYRPMVLMEVEHEDLLDTEADVRQALSDGDDVLGAAFAAFDERLRAHMAEEDRGIFTLAETRPEPEEQALIARKLAEEGERLAGASGLSLRRPEPELALRKAPLFEPAQHPIAFDTLFEAEHDSVQLVRLQAGQRLSPHWAAQHQCVLVLSGVLDLASDDLARTLNAGDQASLSPRRVFSLSAREDAALLIFKVWPKPNYLRG